MFSRKDYSGMTLDELVLEAKSLKSQKIVVAVFTGMMMGIAVWAATHKGGFFLPLALLVLAFITGQRNSQNLKSVQAEISRKGTAD